MGKYANLQTDVFSVFDSTAWKAENIKTFPSNFIAVAAGTEFLRVSVIAGGPGINPKSTSGILIVDIFIPAGTGPNRASLIADKLDLYLSGKSKVSAGKATQFMTSSFVPGAIDKDNPSLYRSKYQIPFIHTEV